MKDNWENQEFATDWDQTSAVTNPNRLALLELLTAIVSDNYINGKFVLDIGCGSGLVEKQILEKLPQAKFAGIDGSEVMLAKARSRLRENQMVAIRHNLEQITDLVLPTNDYQIDISSFVLHLKTTQGWFFWWSESKWVANIDFCRIFAFLSALFFNLTKIKIKSLVERILIKDKEPTFEWKEPFGEFVKS